MEPAKIEITDSFRGFITTADLLKSEGSVVFKVPVHQLLAQTGKVFFLKCGDFGFALVLKDKKIALLRNTAQVMLSPPEHTPSGNLTVIAGWSPTQLKLGCGDGDEVFSERDEVTPATVPPAALVSLALQGSYIRSETFAAVENFRQAVYEVIERLRSKLALLGAANGLWDRQYDGGKLIAAKPKRETDIHPTLHALLSDWSLLRSITITPECHTGGGDMDFAFTGHIAGQGPAHLCAEVKLAHSPDVLHGLTTQLPEYMRRKQTLYGAYIVVWFRGKTFDKPTTPQVETLVKQLGTERGAGEADYDLFCRALTGPSMKSPDHSRIRSFVIDASQGDSASLR